MHSNFRKALYYSIETCLWHQWVARCYHALSASTSASRGCKCYTPYNTQIFQVIQMQTIIAQDWRNTLQVHIFQVEHLGTFFWVVAELLQVCPWWTWELQCLDAKPLEMNQTLWNQKPCDTWAGRKEWWLLCVSWDLLSIPRYILKFSHQCPSIWWTEMQGWFFSTIRLQDETGFAGVGWSLVSGG